MRLLTRRYRCFFSKKKQQIKEKTVFPPQILKQFNEQKLKHIPNIRLPSPQMKNILITSALPYVNNTPHLGNIIGAVLSADVYARYCRLMGHNVLYICGTDQYGTATQVKALQQKTTPQEICDKFHKLHKSIYEWFDISFDHFGRTSSQTHTNITQEIFQEIYQNENITEKTSNQLFCSHCDLYLADRYVNGDCKKCGSATRGDQCESCSTIFNNLSEEISNIKCSICKNTPTPRQTTHLYLNLGKQVTNLKDWLYEKGISNKWSNNAKGVTKGWFNSPIQDRCITRDLKWGIPVPLPGYQKKVFYVWFEAPLGYISITADLLKEGYKDWWIKKTGTDVELKQFMGKDNILFHSIISPACLMGTNQQWQLPDKLSVTEYLKYEGGKFSKSNNVGVFGDQCQITDISNQCWRYYLLRIRPESFDSEFTWADFAQKCNKELLNSIGNLFQRILKFSYRQNGASIPAVNQSDLGQDELALINQFSAKFLQFKEALDNIQILQGANIIGQLSFMINQYVGKTEFWRKKERKNIIIGFLIRMLRIYSLCIEPFVPALSAKMNYLLGCSNEPHPGIYTQLLNLKPTLISILSDSKGIRQPIPLIKEITEEQIKLFKSKFGSHVHI